MFKVEAIRAWAEAVVVQVNETNKVAGQKAMVATAVRERDRVLAGTPHPSGYRQFVNNVADAALETVTYNGVIVFAWQYLEELARNCFEALVLSSPIVTREYIKSIAVLLNDDTGKAGSSLDDISADTRRVTIVPTADYARRLEVGLRPDMTTKFVVQVPLHNVEMVARMLASKYRDLADIQFNYVDVDPAYVLTRDFQSRRRQPHETHVRYPAIIIEPRIAG